MEHQFIYLGCFINSEELDAAISGIRRNRLKREIQHPHITISYRPERVKRSMFGKLIHVTIIGYGNDEMNEGLLVRLYSDDSDVQAMIERVCVPHITLSVSSEGKSLNTRYLSFESIAPIQLTGRFGGFTQNGRVILKA